MHPGSRATTSTRATNAIGSLRVGHRCYPFRKQPGARRQPGNQGKNRCRATGQIVAAGQPGEKLEPGSRATYGSPVTGRKTLTGQPGSARQCGFQAMLE